MEPMVFTSVDPVFFYYCEAIPVLVERANRFKNFC